jgi:hypothetical protein
MTAMHLSSSMALNIVNFQEDQTQSTYIGFCIAGMPVDDVWFTQALFQLGVFVGDMYQYKPAEDPGLISFASKLEGQISNRLGVGDPFFLCYVYLNLFFIYIAI